MLYRMKRTAIVLSVIFGSIAVLLATAFFAYLGITWGVKLDRGKLSLDTSCIRLYDSAGEQIERAARSSVSLEGLPAYVGDAFVAVEDKRFYTHHGFDYRRIGKAMLKNMASLSFREGASTISQQLIKNTHLTGEKTLKRKLRELKLTRILERHYSKEEILELYLNSIYFGHDAFGIGSACDFYFGKDAEGLTPAESAMLAALVRSPGRYSPFRNPSLCLSRRNFVLRLMKEQGYLSEKEYGEAIDEPLPEAPSGKREAGAYLSVVFDELAGLFPDAKSGELGGLRVFTYLDPSLQSELEKTEKNSDFCVLVRENGTNALKALHSTCGILNRMPASTLKPLLVYGPAIEEDFISPATPILDERVNFAGYMPDDAGGASNKYVSAREALAKSVNIPAVKILNSIGCERAVKYLEKMNLHVDKGDYTLALALGGMREGYTLPALADAYATFANGGFYSPSHAIRRVEDSSGRVLYECRPQKTHVFSEETSYLICDMLRTAAEEGTARRLRSLPYPVCAKTGTAEGKGGNTDAYTLAFTHEDTVAVWLGNRDNTPIQAVGGGAPANVALRIFQALYPNGEPEPFPTCDKVARIDFDREEYDRNHRIVLADPLSPTVCRLSELFKTSAAPREQCSRFSCPIIEKPSISIKNGAVYIELCQTQYYAYIVKRENRGKITTIYSGKYQKIICDNSVRAGESYRYTVIPVYNGVEGEGVELPLIRIAGTEKLPDEWWND